MKTSGRDRVVRRLLLTAALAAAAFVIPSATSALAAAPGCVEGTPHNWTCTAAPLNVGGYAVRQDVLFNQPQPAETGYITHMETDVVDEDGTPIPISRLMLHHIVFLNTGNFTPGDATCSSISTFEGQSYGFAPERFFAAGEERAKLSMPPGYGYQYAQNQPLGIVYMLMNHKPVADTAYIQYKITYSDTPVQPVRPYWFDINNCKADPIYNVPGTGAAHSLNIHRRDFTMRESGRIVAGAGHVHGGAKKLTLTEPACNDRKVAESDPTWGLASHPFYNVKPVLHEPGPINMSAFRTPTGIPVKKGQKIRLNSIYDDSQPHVRVMGIFIVFVAPDAGVTQPCGAIPGDIETLKTNEPGREKPVKFTIPLTGLDQNGHAITINAPPGKIKRLHSGATIKVGDRYFSRPNVRVKKGSKLKWNFDGDQLHNVTLANGPVGIGSPNSGKGKTFTKKFTRAGTYRIFCALHPVDMSERIIVTKPAKHRKHRN